MEVEVAEILLKNNAVTLRPDKPFTYVSGIISPIYCDNRLLMSNVAERRKIVDFYLEAIKKNNLDADVIAGTESAGIPWSAWIAERLNKPMIFVRKKQKDHGKENRIEGVMQKGAKVLVIEDLVSTGGSSLAAVESVREQGGDVVACLAIFSFQMASAEKNFADARCKLVALSNFWTLVRVAAENGYIKKEEQALVLEWSKNPEQWGRK
ncbi:MAG: orotate phosphoribosyltransferase [Candidatus Woesearchaeota archaeon]